MENATVVAGLMSSQLRLFFQHEQAQAALRFKQTMGGSESNNATTNDKDILIHFRRQGYFPPSSAFEVNPTSIRLPSLATIPRKRKPRRSVRIAGQAAMLS